MATISLPPGFRFHPTDVELVMYYLKRKVMGKKLHFEVITEVNIYDFSPSDLPDKSCLKSKDLEWFFFCAREKKYASGVRVNRSAKNGFWKTTGNDRRVIYNNNTVGMVKTLIFHNGLASNGQRTDWVMHEFRILDNQLAEAGVQDTYVLCKVFKKNGPGPKNGAQYGAPFNEADWDSDDDTLICSESLSPTMSALHKTKSFSGLAFKTVPGSMSGLSSIEASPSSVGPVSDIVPNEPDDDIVRLLDPFTDDSMLHINDKENYEMRYKQHVGNEETDIYIPGSNGNDIYNGLGDLDNWVQMSEGGSDASGMQEDGQLMNNMPPQNDVAYLELNDLIAPLDFCPEVNATEEMPFGNLFRSYGLINMNYLNFNGNISGVNQYASGPNLHLLLPEGSSRQEDCFNELQMVNNNGVGDSLGNNSANDLGFNFNQPREGGDIVKRQKRDLNSNHYSSSSQLIQHQLERIVSFQCLTWWSLYIMHALSVMLVGTTFGSAGCLYLKKEMLQNFG